MTEQTALVALLLGLIEGLTEFIPVSSTGHLLLAGHFLGFVSAGRTFEVVIQLGAVLAVITLYAGRLVRLIRAAPHSARAAHFLIAVLVAFLPAVIVGVLAHGIIKKVLFETPALIALMLVLGGIVLLFVDRIAAAHPRYREPEDFPLSVALKIGLCQCLAMIPGVSRSGATIVGALMLGADRRAAAEFSFFLSMPTMAAAFTYDLWKSRALLDTGSVAEIAIGFGAAFVAGALVVKWLLGYLSRHGYALFAWWRIIVGSLAMAALWLGF